MPVFILVKDSFRFYRMKNPTVVRILFLFAYMISFLRIIFPVDMNNLNELAEYAAEIPTSMLIGMDTGAMPVISQATYLWVGIQGLVAVLLLFTMLLYAAIFVSLHEGGTIRAGLRSFLRGIPRLVVSLFMFLGVISFSLMLGSPFLFVFILLGSVLTMYFLPLYIFREKMKLGWAMNRSFRPNFAAELKR